jgi:hypothetical protein
MANLNYFVGKLCTIITYQTTRVYNDEQHANTFTGIVDEIDNNGVWMRILPLLTKRAFFSVPLCGIIEEEVIPITPEQEKAIKAEYVKEPTPENLISISDLKSKVDRMKALKNSEK